MYVYIYIYILSWMRLFSFYVELFIGSPGPNKDKPDLKLGSSRSSNFSASIFDEARNKNIVASHPSLACIPLLGCPRE